MFKLTNEQLRWKELIKNNDKVLIYANRGMGKSLAMRTLPGNVLMFVNTYTEVNKYTIFRGKYKTNIFTESSLRGLHPDIIVFDDVEINKNNFGLFKDTLYTTQAKVVVIGTYHYWEVNKLFKEIGVINEL